MAEYIKARPREWIKMNALHCVRVEPELQYMEHILVIQHREAWQNYPAVQKSKSEVFMFTQDLQKALMMEAPGMSVRR
jgi:hypothetical protein